MASQDLEKHERMKILITKKVVVMDKTCGVMEKNVSYEEKKGTGQSTQDPYLSMEGNTNEKVQHEQTRKQFE